MSAPGPGGGGSRTHRAPGRRSEPDRVVDAVLTASRVLVAVSARSLAEVETITLTQFRLLVVLDSRRGSNLNRLAETLGVNPSTAVRTVDRLVSAGLVTRRENPSTRREVVLDLTEEGRRVVRSVTSRRRREIARILGRMPEKRREDLLEAFGAFAEAAGEPPAGDAYGAALGW